MNNADQPAYPTPIAQGENGIVMDTTEYSAINGGLTKREMFAMSAMQGILSWEGYKPFLRREVSIAALKQADALLKELSNE